MPKLIVIHVAQAQTDAIMKVEPSRHPHPNATIVKRSGTARHRITSLTPTHSATSNGDPTTWYKPMNMANKRQDLSPFLLSKPSSASLHAGMNNKPIAMPDRS
jgi:hypothetical protein